MASRLPAAASSMGMRVLAAGPPPMVGAGTLAARLLDAGAPASAVARLLGARPMAQVVDFGALAAAAGATSHDVTAINLGALATAAYGRELAAGAPGHAVAATNFVALSTAIYGRELSVGAPAPRNPSLPVLAAGAPGHVMAAAIDFGALDAAAYQPPSSSRVAPLAAAAGVPARVVAAALDFRALDVTASTSRVAALAAGSGVPARVVAAALDFGALGVAVSTSRVAALAAGSGVPARVVATALDFGALGAAAYRTSSTSRFAANRVASTMLGRTRGGLSPPARAASGRRMFCNRSGGVKNSDYLTELNALRGEVFQLNHLVSSNNKKLWEQIGLLRVKTMETASRMMISVYGLIGGALLFLMPYIKSSWQEDTLKEVRKEQTVLDQQIADLSNAVTALTMVVEKMAGALQKMSENGAVQEETVSGLLDMVRDNGEKIEALAAALAAAEKKQEERELKEFHARLKKEQEEKRRRWF